MDLEFWMRDNVELFAFHDERLIPDWLYHGFVFCEISEFSQLKDKLIRAKNDCRCSIDKRIHFSELTSKSTSSTRTKTALKWMRIFVNELYNNCWFYLFGVNLPNIDYEFFGPSTDGQDRDFRIYNRFFEIGLFSACRFFFDSETKNVDVVKIFSEKRDLERHNPFLTHTPDKVNKRESNIKIRSQKVIQVASRLSREKQYPECVHIINFVDVLTGSFSQVIDYTSRQDGCIEVAEKTYPICRRLMENPYNKNSRFYKRLAISFFPKYPVSKWDIDRYGIIPPQDQFYWKRVIRLYQPCMPGFEGLIQ
jgi:hypothetical protein